METAEMIKVVQCNAMQCKEGHLKEDVVNSVIIYLNELFRRENWWDRV